MKKIKELIEERIEFCTKVLNGYVEINGKVKSGELDCEEISQEKFEEFNIAIDNWKNLQLHLLDPAAAHGDFVEAMNTTVKATLEWTERYIGSAQVRIKRLEEQIERGVYNDQAKRKQGHLSPQETLKSEKELQDTHIKDAERYSDIYLRLHILASRRKK